MTVLYPISEQNSDYMRERMLAAEARTAEYNRKDLEAHQIAKCEVCSDSEHMLTFQNSVLLTKCSCQNC
jgi:hypothetical protein